MSSTTTTSNRRGAKVVSSGGAIGAATRLLPTPDREIECDRHLGSLAAASLIPLDFYLEVICGTASSKDFRSLYSIP